MQPELKTDSIWYASMGSGQLIADPFLALMRKVFWKNGMPTLAEGIFAAVWTLQHTIDINPGGVGGPMVLATLSWQDKVGGTAVARFLSDDEMMQHKQSVEAAERHLADFREKVGGSDQDAPDLPTPEAA